MHFKKLVSIMALAIVVGSCSLLVHGQGVGGADNVQPVLPMTAHPICFEADVLEPVLPADCKEAFYTIEQAIERFEPSAEITLPAELDMSKEDVVLFCKAILNDPSLYWVEGESVEARIKESDEGPTLSLTLAYRCTKAEKANLDEKLEMELRAALEELGPTLQTTLATSERVDSWLCDHVVYMDCAENMTDTVIGPLVYGQGTCAGIAKTYTYLMAFMGHKSEYVVGNTETNRHAWNRIRADKTYFCTDTTFDLAMLRAGYKKPTYLNVEGAEFDDRTESFALMYELVEPDSICQ